VCKETDRRSGLLRNRLKHHLHPMHIYCRLCNRVDDHVLIGKICIWYEHYVWGWFKKLIEALPDRRC
jgi:hypothetical protein